MTALVTACQTLEGRRAAQTAAAPGLAVAEPWKYPQKLFPDGVVKWPLVTAPAAGVTRFQAPAVELPGARIGAPIDLPTPGQIGSLNPEPRPDHCDGKPVTPEPLPCTFASAVLASAGIERTQVRLMSATSLRSTCLCE